MSALAYGRYRVGWSPGIMHFAKVVVGNERFFYTGFFTNAQSGKDQIFLDIHVYSKYAASIVEDCGWVAVMLLG